MPPSRAILLTPPGPSAIAVVRLTGSSTAEFLDRHFSQAVATGRAVHGELRDGGRIIDDVVVLLAPDQRFADVNLHGGTWVIRSMLELARREGFEVIDRPGLPLPDDAVDAEDALQREVLANLPLARTELGVRALLAQPRAWRRIDLEKLDRRRIDQILNDRSLHWLLHPPHVAVIGAPNVGKSTLANQLFAQERSITADLPGTTRDWVGEIANLDGLPVMLIDTPGHRDTSDQIERQAIAQSRSPIRRADLIVLVLDASRPIDPGQRPLLQAHPDALIVLNKTDLAEPAASVPGGTPAIPTVATTGQGVDALRRAICRHFDCEEYDPRQPRCWTARQRNALQLA